MPEEKKLIKLEAIEIPVPCRMEWDKLDGDEQKRFCGDCQKHVFNLSSMTRAEAEQLLTASDARICVSYEQTRDGLMVTQDTHQTFFASRAAVRSALTFAASALMATWAILPANAQNAPGNTRRLLGKVVAPSRNDSTNSGITSTTTNNTDTTNTNSANGNTNHAGTTNQPQPSRMTGAPVVTRTTGEAVMPVPGPIGGNTPPHNGITEIKTNAQPQTVTVAGETKLLNSRDGKIQGLLFGQDIAVRSSLSSGSQPVSWPQWYHSVQRLLFESWKQQSAGEGQITVQLTVKPGQHIDISRMGVPHGGSSAIDRDRFVGSVQSAVFDVNRKALLALPSGANNVQEVTFAVTFGSDTQQFPRYAVTRF